MAGSPRVEQRDARAALDEMQRRPATERSGADDDDMGPLRTAGVYRKAVVSDEWRVTRCCCGVWA